MKFTSFSVVSYLCVVQCCIDNELRRERIMQFSRTVTHPQSTMLDTSSASKSMALAVSLALTIAPTFRAHVRARLSFFFSVLFSG